MKAKTTKPSCPGCQSKQVLYRVRANTYICRVCGNVWAKPETVKKP